MGGQDALPSTQDASEVMRHKQPLAVFGGELPGLLRNEPTSSLDRADASIPSPRRGERLAVLLMPDAIGRLIQHPIFTILAGAAFGLLLLRWLLGS